MWAFVKLALGALMLFGAVNGTIHMTTSDNKGAEDRQAKAEITALEVRTVSGSNTPYIRGGGFVGGFARGYALARSGQPSKHESDFYMQYSFVAEDGKTYGKRLQIDYPIFKQLKKGQTIPVFYNSKNPFINAAPQFRGYVSAAEIEQYKLSPPYRIALLMLTFAAGSYLTYSGASRWLPQPAPAHAPMRPSAIARLPRGGAPKRRFG